MIKITQHAWQQIYAAIQYRPDKEVSFFGKVHLEPTENPTEIVLTDIYVPPQKVGGAHAEIEAAGGGLDKLMEYVIGRHEQPSEWRFFGHSHAGMGTTPSQTDRNTMRDFAKIWGWACGIVFNNKSEATGYGAALVRKPPFMAETVDELTTIPVHVEAYQDAKIVKQVKAWMAEVDDSPPKPIVVTQVTPVSPEAGGLPKPWWASGKYQKWAKRNAGNRVASKEERLPDKEARDRADELARQHGLAWDEEFGGYVPTSDVIQAARDAARDVAHYGRFGYDSETGYYGDD